MADYQMFWIYTCQGRNPSKIAILYWKRARIEGFPDYWMVNEWDFSVIWNVCISISFEATMSTTGEGAVRFLPYTLDCSDPLSSPYIK